MNKKAKGWFVAGWVLLSISIFQLIGGHCLLIDRYPYSDLGIKLYLKMLTDTHTTMSVGSIIGYYVGINMMTIPSVICILIARRLSIKTGNDRDAFKCKMSACIGLLVSYILFVLGWNLGLDQIPYITSELIQIRFKN
jgi:hypothetical protein